MNIRKWAETLTIMATGVVLVAHGGNEQLCALYDGHSVDYAATGSCGVGTITLDQNKGRCALSVQGDDIGVPRQGSVDSDSPLEEGRWRLGASNASGEMRCSPTAVEGTSRLELKCYEGHYTSPREVCSVTLIPVEACDLRSCPEVECEAGFHPEPSDDDCCPECVADPPSVSLDPCDEVTCEACPDDTVAENNPGRCCPTCRQVDLEACAIGRQEYDDFSAEFLEPYLACEEADDCMYASLGTMCRVTCPLPINKYQVGEAFMGLNDEAEALCSMCPQPQAECPPFDPSSTVVCVEGRCEFAP